MFLPLIEILINGLVDSFLIAAVATAGILGLAVMCVIGSLWLLLKAVNDIMRIIFRVPDRVVRREFIDADGRRGVEEIPYQPALNMLTAVQKTGESMRRLN